MNSSINLLRATAISLLVFTNSANAEVEIEGACFKSTTHLAKNLILQYYFDSDRSMIVGGFVKYEGEKNSIPISLLRKASTSGVFEMRWLELINGEITGIYILREEENTIGESKLEYTNTKTKKMALFNEISNVSYCAALRQE